MERSGRRDLSPPVQAFDVSRREVTEFECVAFVGEQLHEAEIDRQVDSIERVRRGEAQLSELLIFEQLVKRVTHERLSICAALVDENQIRTIGVGQEEAEDVLVDDRLTVYVACTSNGAELFVRRG